MNSDENIFVTVSSHQIFENKLSEMDGDTLPELHQRTIMLFLETK